MTVAVDPLRQTVLRIHAVNAVRAMYCTCEDAPNRSDEYAGIEPCDRCGALAILRADPDRPRYPTF